MRRAFAIRQELATSAAAAALLLAGLFWAADYHYLLFHSAAEGFSIAVAGCIFMIAWNARGYLTNHYLLLVGIACLFVAGLLGVHALAYRGMPIFAPDDGNRATQLWLATRYVQAGSLVIAPLFIRRRVNAYVALAAYAVVTGLLLASIFRWRVFPDCFHPEKHGLTPFKIVSEYILCGMFVGAIGLLVANRHRFDRRVLGLLVASMGIAACAEVLFTRYTQAYGEANRLGHFLDIVSFYLLYKAIVETGLNRPLALLMNDLKRSEEQLRESESRYRALVELSPDAIAVHDGVAYVYVNAAGAELFGAKRAEEVVGKRVLELVVPEDRAAIAERIAMLMDGTRTTPPRDTRVFRLDGQIVDVETAAAAISWRGGRAVQLMMRDITERKRSEEALAAAKLSAERAKAAAEQANAAKDQFLAVLSHELRTPLTPVLLSAGSLERDATIPTWLREELGTIRRNVELEARLIDDLLDVTRIIHGKLELRRRELDLHAALREVVGICEGDVRAKGLELVSDWRATEVQVSADEQRLGQVFWNVIKNAVKFTPAGGRIELRTSNPGEGMIRVEVMDNGAGIDPAAIPRLFGAFEQASRETTRQFGGLGLGLAISKAIVELHGGMIRADSEGVGKGAKFTVELPVQASAERRALSGMSSENGRGAGAEPGGTEAVPRAGRLRILLVEDHRSTAEVMAKLLRGAGHEVHAAGDITSAKKLAAQGAFDVVVSDLGLPDGSGLELMRHLKRQYNLRGVALSGYGMEQDVQRSREAGFEEHLTKPATFEELVGAIGRIAGDRV